MLTGLYISALANFYENARSRGEEGVVATYLLCGEAQSRDEDQDMDVDGDDSGEYDDGDEVPETKIMLVGEKDLASTSSSRDALVHWLTCH